MRYYGIPVFTPDTILIRIFQNTQKIRLKMFKAQFNTV